MVKADTIVQGPDKNILLLRIACVFWFIAKLISWRIWTTYRLLPTVPVWEQLDVVPAIVHTLLFAVSLLLILWLILKTNKLVFIGLLINEVLSCMLDQNRLQFWEYHYIFIIFIFTVNFRSPGYIKASIVFLLAGMHFYSGVNKLNDSFLQTVWVNSLAHFLSINVRASNWHWLYHWGYLAGISELMAGMGLLFLKTQTKAACFLSAMHIFIILLFGPLGYNTNIVIWPWNIGIILTLYLVFFKGAESGVNVTPVIIGWNKAIILFWGFLPALSFFGYWDKNLSSNLISGRLPRMIICVNDTSKCKPLQQFCLKKDGSNTCEGLQKINLLYWMLAEDNVIVYAEPRVFNVIQEKLEKEYPAAGLTFTYFDRANEK